MFVSVSVIDLSAVFLFKAGQVWRLEPVSQRCFGTVLVVTAIATRIIDSLFHELGEHECWVCCARLVELDNLAAEHLLLVIVVNLVVEDRFLELWWVSVDLIKKLEEVVTALR